MVNDEVAFTELVVVLNDDLAFTELVVVLNDAVVGSKARVLTKSEDSM